MLANPEPFLYSVYDTQVEHGRHFFMPIRPNVSLEAKKIVVMLPSLMAQLS